MGLLSGRPSGLYGVSETSATHDACVDYGSVPSIVSAVVAVGAFGLTLREKRAATRAAVDAADSSHQAAAAAERNAEALTRLADASDRRTAKPYRPPWKIEHITGSTYALRNTGDDTEENVMITGRSVRGAPVSASEVHAGSSLSFLAIGAWGIEREIVVRWNHGSLGEQPLWRDELPFKE